MEASTATAAGEQPQTATDEFVIDDPELEKALDDLKIAKGKAKEAKAKVTMLKGVVDQKLDEAEIEDGDNTRTGVENGDIVRCGKWRITQKLIPEATRNFVVPESSRRSIAAAESEEG